MLNFTPAQAARIFDRIWWPISNDLAIAEMADAGFDAGEFSGPAHSRNYDQMMTDTVIRISTRCGVNEEELWNALQRRWHWYQQPGEQLCQML